MKIQYRIILIFSIALMLSGPVYSGEIVSFVPGEDIGYEVLPHVRVKGLTAEFLDPGNTGLGKAMGYLLWREVLTSISDQAGAGVILARPPGDMRLTEMIRKDYHTAAINIARAQNARMVLWGVVNEADGYLYINSYLTLLPENIGDDLKLNFTIAEEIQEGFSVNITKTIYNFATVKMTRRELFERPVITRRALQLREQPASDAQKGRQVSSGTLLQAVDAKGPWIKVILEDGTIGWIANSNLEIPPREIYADRRNVNIRSGPGNDRVLRKGNLKGVYKVLDMRYIPGSGSWYRLDLKPQPGWVAVWLVQPRFSLPVVNLMAGLYRYQQKNFEEAEKSVRAFLTETKEYESNINLAVAYKLMSGSAIMTSGGRVTSSALSAAEKAVQLTPYDPYVYNFTAVLRLIREHRLSGSLSDIKKALNLDYSNSGSHNLLIAISSFLDPSDRRYKWMRRMISTTPSDKEKVEELLKEFQDTVHQ